MVGNNNRYDLSDRLIHWFRDLDISTNDAPPTPEFWGYGSLTEGNFLPARFLLRHAIRQGRLWATWSVRGGKRTIYGPRPAVCFTEMPIPAFIEASQTRAAKGEAISPYALVFSKTALAQAGALPVISGMSNKAWSTGGAGGGPREFEDSALPLAEQYRFVEFNPARGSRHWMHEREWRWPLPSDQKPWSSDGWLPPESDDLLGLNIDEQLLRGLGVSVASVEEVDYVISDILTKIDRGDIDVGQYKFVLAAAAILDWRDLRDQAKVKETISENLIMLDSYFRPIDTRPASIIQKLAFSIEEKAGSLVHNEPCERGGCWLWLLDNRNPFVRAIVQADLVRVNRAGRYLVALPQFNPARPLREREKMTQDLARDLLFDYDVRADYISTPGCFDPDAASFFSWGAPRNSMVWNTNFR